MHFLLQNKKPSQDTGIIVDKEEVYLRRINSSPPPWSKAVIETRYLIFSDQPCSQYLRESKLSVGPRRDKVVQQQLAAWICLTVMGFVHMCPRTSPRRIVIREIRYLGGTRFYAEPLATSPLSLFSLFRSHVALSLPSWPVRVIIEMSFCLCFDNPITRALARLV